MLLGEFCVANQVAKIMILGERADFGIVLVKETGGHGHQL